VDAGEQDAALGKRGGRVALRRQRILRLLAEAAAADTVPAVADVAGALEVSPHTIRADLRVLRRRGHRCRTRGSRDSSGVV
jgi:DeoR/GlpR family transcriptional regulator of sugar metabolism